MEFRRGGRGYGRDGEWRGGRDGEWRGGRDYDREEHRDSDRDYRERSNYAKRTNTDYERRDDRERGGHYLQDRRDYRQGDRGDYGYGRREEVWKCDGDWRDDRDDRERGGKYSQDRRDETWKRDGDWRDDRRGSDRYSANRNSPGTYQRERNYDDRRNFRGSNRGFNPRGRGSSHHYDRDDHRRRNDRGQHGDPDEFKPTIDDAFSDAALSTRAGPPSPRDMDAKLDSQASGYRYGKVKTEIVDVSNFTLVSQETKIKAEESETTDEMTKHRRNQPRHGNSPAYPSQDQLKKSPEHMHMELGASTTPPPYSSRTSPPPTCSRNLSPPPRLDRKPTPLAMKENKPVVVGNPDAIVCEKKDIAKRSDKQKVTLTTNFWDLKVKSRTIYRYDVNVKAVIPAKYTSQDPMRIDITKGCKDDAAKIDRNRLCLEALKHGLRLYNILSQNGAAVHDGAAILYANEDLANSIKGKDIHVDAQNISKDLYAYIGRPDIATFEIIISPVMDGAQQFDMADLHSQMNRDMSNVDSSLKQFYEILINADASQNRNLVIFGGGKIFGMDNKHLRRERMGQEYRDGFDKSIKFIEGDNNAGKKTEEEGVVPALLLDSKVGTFFKPNTVLQFCRDMYNGRMPSFNWNADKKGRLPEPWPNVEKEIKSLRLHILKSPNSTDFHSLVASSISKKPIRELYTRKYGSNEKESVLEKYDRLGFRDLNPNLPAIAIFRGKNKKPKDEQPNQTDQPNQGDQPTSSHKVENEVEVDYYPMEACSIAPNQRVPKQKMLSDPERADKPHKRLDDIEKGLETLNLHDGGRRNPLLAAFGVELSMQPKKVEGIRREAPKIIFANNRNVPLNSETAAWDDRRVRLVRPGRIDNVVVCHSCDRRDAENVVKKLQQMSRDLGIQIGKWSLEPGCFDDDEKLAKLMSALKEKQQSQGDKPRFLLIHIDHSKSKTHGTLKLFEKKYTIITQQLTTEKALDLPRQNKTCQNFLLKLNCKIGGLNYEVIPEAYSANRWTSSKNVMFVGYDVAHPPAQSRDEVARKVAPTNPSVVGFSFNGSAIPEAFIGDFHYQTPRQEQVDVPMLKERMKWMLGLFSKNRGQLPEIVFLTRDGVSEGQYEMALTIELSAFRDACQQFGETRGKLDYNPKFVLLITTKRHSTRAFKIDGRNVNSPNPLTVIDHTITRPNVSEFYLQSSKAIIGTAKPTYYQVLADDLNLSMDEIQSTMAALCFTHQIVSSPISIPEPVYQADEWAKRGNQMWIAYEDKFQPPRMKERNGYTDFPIDFEKMTDRLSYWHTPLEEFRVNA